MSNSLQSHASQHAKLPCPSLSPKVCYDSCPLNWRCYLTIFPSAALFFCFQSFPASWSFPMSHLFASGNQSIGASASIFPMNVHGWFPLGLSGLISFQSKGPPRVFSSTTIWRHQFFCTQLFLWPNSQTIHDCWKSHSFDYMDLCWQINVSAF